MDSTITLSREVIKEDFESMMPFSKQSVWNFTESEDVRKRTTKPTVTGTSVLGIAFDKGVIICADMLGSYGSMARYRSCDRVMKVNNQIILGAGGDYADFQFLWSIIEQQIIDEECCNDGFNLKPASLHCWLTRTLYNKRSKLEPLWNIYLVGGMENGVPFLGLVDKLGTSFQAPTLATGYGGYLAQPILRTAYEKNPNINEQEARDLLTKCMKVLNYRDCRAFSKYTLGIVTEDGAKIEGPYDVESDWAIGLLTEGSE